MTPPGIVDLLRMYRPEVFDALGEVFRGEVVYRRNHYLFVDRGALVTLVAHADTVMASPPERLRIREGHIMNAEHEPLGADDRAGVYIMLRLSHLPVNLLLTDLEERGCVGARSAAADLLLDGVLVGLDRRNVGEYVHYRPIPLWLHRAAMDAGYCHHRGSVSDVACFPLPAINVSVGFRHEHTGFESLFLPDLAACTRQAEILVGSLVARMAHIENNCENTQLSI